MAVRPLEEIGHLLARQIRRRDLLTLRDAIASARGIGAANNFTKAASVVFGWAVDRNWIESTPATRIKKLAGGHHRAWTRLEADHALAGLPEHLRRFVLLARYTGQRRGDLIVMPWSAYDGRGIRVVQEKTGVVLTVPCHPALKRELDCWRTPEAAGPILRNTRGTPWTDDVSMQLPAALRRLGLPAGLNVHGLSLIHI